MFNSMFDELKEVKYFKEITDSRILCKIYSRNNTFKESSKSRALFVTQASIYDGAFM